MSQSLPLDQLVAACHWIGAKGWAPATGGNMSVRRDEHVSIDHRVQTGFCRRLTARERLAGGNIDLDKVIPRQRAFIFARFTQHPHRECDGAVAGGAGGGAAAARLRDAKIVKWSAHPSGYAGHSCV